MSLKLPNDKIVYNLPEQVGVNAENIKYLAEVYKNIDSIPAQFAPMKAYFDDVMTPAFAGWTTTFQGWTNTLDTYLANMSSAALGAIAGGTVQGNFSVNGDFTANSIIENMSGYSFQKQTTSNLSITYYYAGVVKTGNKITFAISCDIVRTAASPNGVIGRFFIPTSIGEKLIPARNTWLAQASVYAASSYDSGINIPLIVIKDNNGSFFVILYNLDNLMVLNTSYFVRFEITFLLSDNLIA